MWSIVGQLLIRARCSNLPPGFSRSNKHEIILTPVLPLHLITVINLDTSYRYFSFSKIPWYILVFGKICFHFFFVLKETIQPISSSFSTLKDELKANIWIKNCVSNRGIVWDEERVQKLRHLFYFPDFTLLG